MFGLTQKRILLVGILCTMSVLVFGFGTIGQHAKAAINPQINFQGKLTNTDGTNVTNGTYSIVFSMYSVASAGSPIWTETQGSVSLHDLQTLLNDLAIRVMWYL